MRCVCLLVCVHVHFVASALCHSQEPLDDTKPVLGINLIDSRQAIEIWKDNNMPMRLAPRRGAMVVDVIVGTSAHAAGIRRFDLIEKVNSNTVRTVDRINDLLAGKSPGDAVEIQIRRLQGTGWFPNRGTIKCSSERSYSYSQMEVSGSQVTGTQQMSHMWFDGPKDYIAPVIIVPANGKPSLVLEISHVASQGIFPQKLTLKSGNRTATSTLDVFNLDSQVLTDGEVRVHQHQRSTLTDEMQELLREPGTKSYRLDGRTEYVESTMTKTDETALAVVFAVFDDLLATGNKDLSLGGSVIRQ